MKAEAEGLGLVTKRRTDAAAQIIGGGPFSRGHLHWILSNPLYAGRIAHKGIVHPGRHPAIIDPKTFDDVQHRLADNATKRRSEKNTAEPSLLAGLVFDETGDRLCATHTNKKGRRYRYYISKRLMHKSSGANSGGWRLPAKELEAIVLRVVQQLLRDKTLLVSALGLGDARPDLLREVLARACSTAVALRDKATTSQQLLLNLLQRIQLHSDSIHFEIRRSALTALSHGRGCRRYRSRRRHFRACCPDSTGKTEASRQKWLCQAVDSQSLLVDESLVALLADAHRWIDDPDSRAGDVATGPCAALWKRFQRGQSRSTFGFPRPRNSRCRARRPTTERPHRSSTEAHSPPRGMARPTLFPRNIPF